MKTLSPGETLCVTRRTAGLGLEESLDVNVLPKGMHVKYVRPVWLLVLSPDGDFMEVHVDSLEMLHDDN